MKKIYLVLVCAVMLVTGAQAQYYYIPHLNTGQNPGNLNLDSEYPVGGGLPAGWVAIHSGPAATPVWSPVQTLPFNFVFNGTTQTQFKVSTSGVLTFATGAVTVPPIAKAALPNVNIPDMSICIWRLHSGNTGDNIVKKTFGVAPNRQQWIFFTSYNAAGSTNNSQWTYWSIVLEETSNRIFVVDQRTANFAPSFSIGVQVDGSSAYSVNGSPNVVAQAGNDPTPVDNQYYEFIQGVQPANEAALTGLNVQQYVVAPGTSTIGGSIVNNGSAAINTITIKYEVGGNVFTDVKSGLNIGFTQTYNFTHANALNVANPQLYSTKVWIELSGDGNQTNDTLSTDIHGLSFLASKKVVVEEATGTWCGWCPRGFVYMDSIAKLYPNTVLPIAVHNADPMVVTAYDAGMSGSVGGYPSGHVDRKDVDIDPTQFIASYQQRINDVPPCNVSIDALFNPVTRVIDMNVSATFATDLTGDFRFNAVVIEDGVTGTTAQYNQVNYYSFQSNNLPLQGAGHNWQQEPNPVPAANMVYDFVARAIMGGWLGTASSIPTTITANSTYNYNYSYTLPVTYDETKVHVIGWVTDNSNGNILNANRGELAVGINENQENLSFDARVLGSYSDNVHLKLTLKNSERVTVEVFDVTGKSLMNNESKLTAGEYVYNLNTLRLASGIYTVKITAGEHTLAKKFGITH